MQLDLDNETLGYNLFDGDATIEADNELHEALARMREENDDG